MPGSLYDDAAFGAPNLLGSSQIFAAGISPIGRDPVTGESYNGIFLDRYPYGGITQSRDLREIETSYDPVFRANNDIFQLNLELNMGELGLYSQTTYAEDRYYSSQDYNRFVSNPIFRDSEGLTDIFGCPTPCPGRRQAASIPIRNSVRQTGCWRSMSASRATRNGHRNCGCNRTFQARSISASAPMR